jgi:hypothetical protein
MRRPRYKTTLQYPALRDYDIEKVKYVFESSSPKDALRRVEKVYQTCEEANIRLSFYAKQFLEALAISAMTDMEGIR